MKLNVSFCHKNFLTPFILVSGIVVKTDEIIKVGKKKSCAGITTKSFSLKPRKGHPPPTITKFNAGFLNAVGLRNPGIKKAVNIIKVLKQKLKKPVIASIFGSQLSEFSSLVEKISTAKPDIIELNLSCPNVDDEFGKPFALDPLMTALAVLEVKKNLKKIPLVVKLSANTPDLPKVAYEAAKAGADGFSLINTIGPGLLLNIKLRKPILSNRVGGVSGPAIKPIALRAVYEVYKTVKLPLIGIGGISSGYDAIEMIMAGASLVGIGSAIFTYGYQIFDKIEKELITFCQKEKIKTLEEIRGCI